MSKCLFITGTTTDVGKTYVTGLLIKKINEMGFSSAMSGNERDENGQLIPGDALSVKIMSGINQDLKTMCPYIYEMAVSPHLASQIEGNPVDMNVVKKGFYDLSSKYDYITMEGSGGILCPIRMDGKEIWLEDIIKEFSLPSVIVADAGLGTINSVVLTYEYMKKKNLSVKGIIFNNFHPGDFLEEDNKKMCEYMTGIPVIGYVEENGKELIIDDKELLSLFE